MRETRPSGSEGGATELNQSFLPLSLLGGTACFKLCAEGIGNGGCGHLAKLAPTRH